jgi:hypothetical protein
MPQVKFTDAAGLHQVAGTGGLFFEIDTVTQATNSETAVTSNGVAGVITTAALNEASTASTGFTVNNDKVLASSLVIACVVDYDGTVNGTPVAQVDDIAAGSFVIRVTNAGSTTLDAACKIGYLVIGAA